MSLGGFAIRNLSTSLISCILFPAIAIMFSSFLSADHDLGEPNKYTLFGVDLPGLPEPLPGDITDLKSSNDLIFLLGGAHGNIIQRSLC